MKKAIRILICIICCFTLIACSNQAEPEQSSSISAGTQITEEKAVTSEGAEKSTVKANDKSASKVRSSTTESTSGKADKGKKSKHTATERESGKSESTSRKNTESKNTTAKKAVSATTKAQKKTTASYITCTVTIECKKVLDNMDKLKSGHEAYVPSDGMILDSYSVTLKNGCTAYDMLKKACDDNSVSINMSKTVYGTYIVGFNNIDEKDCGSGSGWLYFVNGSSPSRSCAKYSVKNGDSIVFSYTI